MEVGKGVGKGGALVLVFCAADGTVFVFLCGGLGDGDRFSDEYGPLCGVLCEVCCGLCEGEGWGSLGGIVSAIGETGCCLSKVLL